LARIDFYKAVSCPVQWLGELILKKDARLLHHDTLKLIIAWLEIQYYIIAAVHLLCPFEPHALTRTLRAKAPEIKITGIRIYRLP
jgi:hypothetical protein